MKRGDVVTIATGRNFGGKPRPALIVQSDEYAALGNVVALPITSILADPSARIRGQIEPDEDNGLRKTSEIMTDLPVTVPRERVGRRIGALSAQDLARTERALLLVLGFAG